MSVQTEVIAIKSAQAAAAQNPTIGAFEAASKHYAKGSAEYEVFVMAYYHATA